MTTDAIRTEGLTIRYGDLTAVDSLNLFVQKGSVFAFVGPNGAGKTSTIRCLATLLPPDSGSAFVNGTDVYQSPQAVQKTIGYMPDFFGVYDHLAVWEYLDFFGQVYGLQPAARTRKAQEVLEIAYLVKKRDAEVGTLSRGMKQRLCLARTLLHDPDILLLDEPASGVDPKGRYEIRELIRRLGQMGKTVFVSSHILLELSDICNTVGILEAGKLVACGPVSEVLSGFAPTRVLKIRLVGEDGARAKEVLAAVEGVHQVSRSESTLEVQVEDKDEAVARVIEAIVGAGLRIGYISQAEANLEEIYLKLTHGELA